MKDRPSNTVIQKVNFLKNLAVQIKTFPIRESNPGLVGAT